MSTEIKEAIESIARDFEAFKSDNDARIKAISKNGAADPLLAEKVEKTAAAIQDMQEKMDKFHAAMNRSSSGMDKSDDSNGYYSDDAQGALYTKQLVSYLRKGNDSGLIDLHAKALSVSSDPDGGYTVTPATNGRIVEKVFESSPIRQLATVETITSSSYELMVDDDEFGAGWVGENSARAETSTAKLRKVEIPVHELYAMPKASQKLLDDSGVNIEQWLGRRVGDKFGRMEATAFVSGDGVASPRGILTYAAGTAWGQIEQVNSGAAAALTADGLIDLAGAIKEPYQNGAVYLMKRASVVAAMKLKNSQNDYIWKPSLREGQPQSLNGYPVMFADDIPAVGAGNLAVIFGNFREGYTIVDRIGIRVLRDPYSAKPHVMFYTTKRVGGAVVNFDALKIQKISA